MKNYYRVAFVINVVLLFTIAFGCGPKQQIQPLSEDFAHTCIRGTVSYRNPIDSTQAPYPSVKVTAWRHDTNQPLVETQADSAGSYCIEVPLADFRVDLRAWGLVDLDNRSYTCSGSQDNIALGTTSKKCGEDCLKIDIVTDCSEFTPIRRK